MNLNNLNIIQWNINSLNKKRHELQLIIQIYIPVCIALQETNLKNTFKPNIQNYNIYYANRIS